MPRHPDPLLEKRILDAACVLWGQGGTHALTMRAVAKKAGTTTPTVYERYQDRAEILHALRMRTRSELFESLICTDGLAEACEEYLQFAMRNRHAYEVLFDGVAQPPSIHEAWPSFNLMRDRLADRLDGSPRSHTRLMLALWSLLHGAAMLIIRGEFEGALQTQTIHSCIDAVEMIVSAAGNSNLRRRSGPEWPANLNLGEGQERRHKRRGRSGRQAKKAGNTSRSRRVR